MECPHVKDAVNPDVIKPKLCTFKLKIWKCDDCNIQDSLWLCLYCGSVKCGRYIQGHGLKHWEDNHNHSVTMDLIETSIFCYICDDFVINDTCNNAIEEFRQILGSDDSREESTQAAKLIQKRSNSEERENFDSKKRKMSENDKKNGAKKDRKVVGLRNLGNTCFMNAVLQSLSNIQEFCCYFKQLPSFDGIIYRNGRRPYATRQCKDTQDEGLMTEELRKVLISLTVGEGKSAISPECLFNVVWKVVPRFRGYQQQDAHEFLRYMLDRLHTELLQLLPEFTFHSSPYVSLDNKGKSSIVTTIFGGALQNEVTCLECGAESKKHDPFLDLSLDIPNQFLSRTRQKEADNPPACHLTDCLGSFTDVEVLEETELYYCANCKCKQRSTKKFWIRRLPNVLCLHLKRFRWNNWFRTKLDTYVEFPVEALDMSDYILSNLHETRRSGTGSNLYDLAAVIVHHGSGAGSGHYTAFAINEGSWYHFNDSTVKLADEDVVSKCKAYILFYIRREFRLPKVQPS